MAVGDVAVGDVAVGYVAVGDGSSCICVLGDRYVMGEGIGLLF